jgi:hypothetical protein
MSKKHDWTQSVSGRKCNPRQHKAANDKAANADRKRPRRPLDPWNDLWGDGLLAAASRDLWGAFVSDADEDEQLLPQRRDLDRRSTQQP